MCMEVIFLIWCNPGMNFTCRLSRSERTITAAKEVPLDRILTFSRGDSMSCQKLRIAIISEHASPLALLGSVDSGGQNVYVGHSARQLALLGHEVDVFTRKEDPAQPEVVSWNGVRIIHVKAGPEHYVRKEDLLPWMSDFTAFMLAWIRKDGLYDLVHANFWTSGLAALFLKKIHHIPFVMTFHALGKILRLYQKNADEFPVERFEVEEAVVDAADQLIAECPQEKKDLERLYHADPEKISVIPCGFDPQEFWFLPKIRARRLLQLPLFESIALYVGRMVPRKGVDNVIRGVAGSIKKSGVPQRLVLIGGGPRETPEILRLKQIALEEGIARSVFFLGYKNRFELRLYYNAANVFITTPWYEPFGMTPFEAMACGTPVIGSNVGGLQFSVRHGKNGWLIPPQNPEVLTDTLCGFFADPSLLVRLGWQALEWVQPFTWKAMTQQILRVYAKGLAGSTAVAAPSPDSRAEQVLLK